MHRILIFVVLALVTACTPQPGQEIEKDFTQRIEAGGLSGTALAEAYVDRGLLRTATRKHDEAIADFNLAIGTAPDLAEAYVWRGAVMGVKGDKVREREDYDRALAIDPNYWFAHGALGLILANSDQDDAALTELARALELGKPHQGEYFVREIKQRKIWRQNPIGPPSRGTWTQSFAIAANDHLALYHAARAKIFLKRNDEEATLAELDEFDRLVPNNFLTKMNRMGFLLKLGRCDDVRALREAMKKQSKLVVVPTQPGSMIGFVGLTYLSTMKDKCPELAEP